MWCRRCPTRPIRPTRSPSLTLFAGSARALHGHLTPACHASYRRGAPGCRASLETSRRSRSAAADGPAVARLAADQYAADQYVADRALAGWAAHRPGRS